MKKRGTILVENVIFIILNLLFLIILILFIAKQGSGAIIVEQSYAKQIALLIDSAKPISIIELNMDQALEIAEDNEISFDDVVKINPPLVRVKLSENSGYEYSFFNDIEISAYPGPREGIYIFIIGERAENE